MANNQGKKPLSLFNDELEVLKSCSDDLLCGQYADNILLPKYKEIIESYAKLLKFAQKVVKISDTQGKVLKLREYKIKSILDNSQQGFLTFGEDLLVDEEYSAECVRIFNKKIKKHNVVELLSKDLVLQQQYKGVFTSALQKKKVELFQELPARIFINQRHIDIDYKLINWVDDKYAILVVLTDVTEKIMVEAKIKYLSERDSLTCLYNRSYVDNQIPKIINEFNLPISVILADMNALKLTNDVFGHQKGDELIVNVANIITTCCRQQDIIARWGGDEFLIILPNTEDSYCQSITNNISNACSEAGHEFIEISVSMGTATMNNLSTNLSDLFAIAESKMYKNKLLGSKEVRRNIIKKMETVLDSRAIVPQGHIIRVKEMVSKFADILGLTDEAVDRTNLIMLASLHDVGKLALPEDILNKQGKLTAIEWEIIKRSNEIGYRMAQSIGEPIVAEAILALRERWDGTGYPNGLRGEQIPYIARILGIIEAFDMMTSSRPYRCALSKQEAIEEIRNLRGRQFDPTLSEIFINNLEYIRPI